ncbi:MAG: transketolase [Ruminococcus sp.]|uniref:transketolase n=1 Tax=Ruminococcus sp. TaxID=41978 RepID=UPI001B019375|nr:transketolase [Ruminococcus sp.]MBO7473355.1 transketolase [Ruminococcus sp.]
MDNDKIILKRLRKQIFLTGYKGGLAHFASCYSCLEIIYTLYCKGILRIDKKNPKWKERDRFILSKGHAGLALYAVLTEQGLISKERFESYLQSENCIGGEPCMRDSEWIEATTGSLGHGLSMGLGMAIANKTDNRNAKVYVILGDGECEEGTVWEAAMSASALKLDNLIVILDCNRIQKMDFVNRTIGSDNWRQKMEAFGWLVKEVDGHDVNKLYDLFLEKNDSGLPLFIIAHTTKGNGVSIMENMPNWHFKLPNKKELKIFQTELDIDSSEME